MIPIQNVAKKVFVDKVKNQSGIWLIDVSGIPYHLGFSVEGHYYSLKYKTKDTDLKVENLIEALVKRKNQWFLYH